MKITADRLAVAVAAGRACLAAWRLPEDAKPVDLRAVIEAIPEPEPDVPYVGDPWTKAQVAKGLRAAIDRADLPTPKTADDIQEQIEWPDWLSREYQAIVKMVKDAMRRAEDDIRNSEDASGLCRTAAGERNVYAGAVVHAFKRAGWLPPAQVQARCAPDTHGRIYAAGMERGKADVQAQIDAAVTRERKEIADIIATHLRAFMDDGHTFTGAAVLTQLQAVLHTIRARSAKGV